VIIVSDNSALSCLAELGELELLNRLYGAVTITATVRKEGCHPGAPEALRLFLEDPPAWLVVVPDAIPYLEETHDLDAGEASAITLAWKHRESSPLIIDEKRGRRASAALGIRIIPSSVSKETNAGVISHSLKA
jgi:predicted nucleic acid-binding protein